MLPYWELKGDFMIDISSKLQDIIPELEGICNNFHENPELSLQEFKTCAAVEDYINKYVTYERMKRVGETGLFVEIKGTLPGKRKIIAIREDMDALPIQEAENMPHRSKVDGVMHACGHDVHATCGMGAARIISDARESFCGSVYMYFQPAEEVLKGATMFLNDPETGTDKLDAIIAVHASPEIDAGTIGVRHGAILASADEIRIKVTGKGGHAAHPQTFIDPVLAASATIVNIQSIIAREKHAMDSAVVSMCSIHGGAAHNIIPDYVEIAGTARTVSHETRDMIEESIKRIAETTAQTYRCTAEVEYIRGVSPVICEDEWVDRSIRVGEKLLGKNGVNIMPYPSMGGDDFSLIKEKCEGVFIRLGSRTPGGAYGSLHSPTFYSDPAAIPAGIATLAGVILDAFGVEYK